MITSTTSYNESDTVDILGLPVNRITMDRLLELSDQCIASGQQLLLGVVNAAKVVNSRNDILLRQSLEHSDIVLARRIMMVIRAG